MTQLEELTAEVRRRMAELMTGGHPARDTALLLADLEEEQDRRLQVDRKLATRVAALGSAGTASAAATVASVFARPLPGGLDARAGIPRSHRTPNADEAAR